MKFICAFLIAVSIVGSANGANIYVNASICNDYNAVDAGYTYSIGLKSNGSMTGWGNNYDGQATPPTGYIYTAISAGYSHGLALKSDGSIAGWGDNSKGQATAPDGNDYIAVSATYYSSIALKSDGSIIGWGAPDYQAPPPAGNDYVAISAGLNHSIALKSDGSLAAWSRSDDYNQVSGMPDGNDYIAISAGYFYSIALKSDGSIVAWGSDDYGQISGVPDGNDYVAISAGAYHCLALKNDGSIVAWGDNTYGQTTAPDGNDYIKIAAGSYHNVAIKSDKSVIGWGLDVYGETTPPAGVANDGSSWTNAFINLQDALDAAVSTDIILVAAGTYYPSARIIPGNPRSAVFSLKNGVTVLGGFAAAGEPNLSDRNPQLHKTILSGDLGKNDGPSFTNRSDNCYHVLFADAAKALNNTAVLDGFTISGGQADGSSPHNTGGGMYNYSSSPKIINCTFTDNQGQMGGAVFNQSCSPKFINSIIAANKAGLYGGGLANLTASPSLVNCAVYGNNVVTNSGGGFYNASSSTPVLTNCIVWANTKGVTPDQIFDNGSTTTATYCDVQGGYFGVSNINADPHFVNASGNDFHLQYDSVCIDAGDNSVVTVANDFEMETRICHSKVDMGPDEVTGYAISASAEPVAGGTVAFDPNYVIFAAGTEVNVLAVANSGYTFDHWSGALSGSANPASLTIIANTSVTAHFIFTGEIIYVDDSSSAVEPNGKSWQYAFKDLEPALAAAGPGKQIWVAKGTYYPSRVIYFGYPRSAAYQLKNGVPVFGGFNGTENRTTFNLDSRDFNANETILSADIGLPGFDFDNAYHVFLHPADLALNASALLDGFTITAANADDGGHGWGSNGGGMYNDSASPTIRNCKFINNKAMVSGSAGGGMYNYQASPVIMNCTFLNNSSQQNAGAMSNSYSSPVISGCVFRGNSAVNVAGGIYNWEGIATITDCLFEENIAYYYGGGIVNGTGANAVIENCSFINNTGNGMFNSSCSPVITGCLFRGNTRNYGSGMTNQTASPEISNCLFIENVTTSSSGILYNYVSSAPVVVNCTFANNTAKSDGVIVNSESSLTMTNSIVWGNNYNTITNMSGSSAVVTYTDFQGGYTGTGNINITPMFTDTNSDDYHLQPGSQCIDVGNDSAVPENVIGDMDGTPRIIDGNCDAVARVDMGCYEFSHKWFGDLNEDCKVNLLDIAVLGNHWKTNSAQADIAPGYGDGFVNMFDLAKIAENWLID